VPLGRETMEGCCPAFVSKPAWKVLYGPLFPGGGVGDEESLDEAGGQAGVEVWNRPIEDSLFRTAGRRFNAPPLF
jgi:hypothetical protein